MTSKFPDRCFAFDQFGPLSIRPTHGAAWAPVNRPDRLPATYHRTHGVRYLHGCYSLGDDQLWGITRRRKGADHTLAALKTIRAARPDAAPIYVILDNLSANKTPTIRAWAKRYAVELCLTPTQASWANPIEAQFGPLRTFVMGGSNPPNHTVLARALQAYLRWRNANTRHPDVLAAQRRERARIRSERQQRWGRPKTPAARSNPANVSGHRTSHATIGGDAGGGGGRAAGPGRRVGHAATGRRATHLDHTAAAGHHATAHRHDHTAGSTTTADDGGIGIGGAVPAGTAAARPGAVRCGRADPSGGQRLAPRPGRLRDRPGGRPGRPQRARHPRPRGTRGAGAGAVGPVAGAGQHRLCAAGLCGRGDLDDQRHPAARGCQMVCRPYRTRSSRARSGRSPVWAGR